MEGFAEPPIPKGTLRGEGGVTEAGYGIPTPTYISGSLKIGSVVQGLFKGRFVYNIESEKKDQVDVSTLELGEE